ncbi:ABC transporter ATP-binding protein [Phytoactinopolyspora halotolerans]|uniref:ABC transporter ATP-binding protein n=2 Tax=Phytoactinopolyspora halotolerans TaxID=1981512 RepID=A0A6L9SI95_9ACTN|nr:ABC transporter ATP-binding protein [Phytoactinopolyspora halotolerans]
MSSAAGAVLAIEDLRTHFHTRDGVVKAVDGVDLEVSAGTTLCVVGESGCGKSMMARSVLGLIEPPGRVQSGAIWWQPDRGREGTNLATLDPHGERLRRVRGAEIGMVFQEPIAALSPMYTVGAQLVEAIRLHTDLSMGEAKDRAIAELTRVGIPRPEKRFDAYPFQLSGGMCQRVMIAIALCCDPALLIADEPTTALDVTTQARILDLLGELQEQTGMAVMFITHDMGVVAEIADEVAVMYLGRIVERACVDDIFASPAHPYTQALLESIPSIDGHRKSRLAAIEGLVPHPSDRPAGCPFHPRCRAALPGLCDVEMPDRHQLGPDRLAACHLYAPSVRENGPLATGRAEPVEAVSPTRPGSAVPRKKPGSVPGQAPGPRETTTADVDSDVRADADVEPLLTVRDVRVHFPVKHGLLRRAAWEVKAVAGVSLEIMPGETLGLVGESGCGKSTLGRAIVRALEPTEGAIWYRDGETGPVDLARLRGRELQPYRGKVRMIFQDPFGSLNPRKTLLQIIGEPLRRLPDGVRPDSSLPDRVAEMLRAVGLRPEYMWRYPHAFSGGERQRINIARALITQPRLVIADEAVSALDVSIRAQILNLLGDLQAEMDLTYLFISHDLSVVQHVCDRVAVMHLGSIVEQAGTDRLFAEPRHPYTAALLSAVPVPDPRRRGGDGRIRLDGELPDSSDPPAGCGFHVRCPYRREERCMSEVPSLVSASGDHGVACHHADELDLQRPSSAEPRARVSTGRDDGLVPSAER